LAPPSAGIYDLVEQVARKVDLVHLRMSLLLDKAYSKQTASGIQAKSYMERGLLVPDAVIMEILLQELRENNYGESGYILDGFPRTKAQALSLIQSGNIPDYVSTLQFI
jgi:adenylate kinase